VSAPAIRLLEPAPGVLAFYAGRDGSRFASEPNWVDEGAISLGVASYALLAGAEALVYDTGISVEWGRFVRAELERRGAHRLTVVLSHWHLDHVAGTEAFAGCEVVANARTAAHLAAKRAAIEAGELEGPPPIAPLVEPTRTFGERERFELGSGEEALAVEALALNIHSDDATALWLPARRLLLAGDTMEDTVTFVDEPAGFGAHLRDLERLRRLGPERILPNHGDPDAIAGGGYPVGLIDATESYVRFLRDEPAPGPLRDLLPSLEGAGALRYFEPYEAVHRHNLATVAC
jgi:cyclase